MYKRHRTSYSYAHLPPPQPKKLEGFKKNEENNRQTRSLHGLRTMRSLLHNCTFKNKRHNKSIQQRTPQTNKQNPPRSKQTRFLCNPVSPLRRCTLCRGMLNWCNDEGSKNRRSYPQQREMYWMLDMHHGLPLRRTENGQGRSRGSQM